jgi:hypothetical protein
MDGGAICKVILETSLLNDDEKTRGACAAGGPICENGDRLGPGGRRPTTALMAAVSEPRWA